MRRCLPAVTFAAIAGLGPALVLANGRPPVTNGVFLRPGDARALYVRTTFGLLISHDDGCSFRWVCEKAIGYGGEFDPKYAIATDGTIFATTFTGLRVSRDGGCTWETATADKPQGDPGRIADVWIDAIDIGPGGEVWVATADSGRPNNLFHSTDNGATFTPSTLGSATTWWKSIKVARANPQRLYATGYQVAPSAMTHLEVSDDGGATWTERTLATTLKYGSTPLLIVNAVDPNNADHVFVTSIGATPPNGDVVYRSTDGGVTLTEVLATVDPVRDIVVRANGVVDIASRAGGTYELAAGATTFQRLGQTTPNGPDAQPPQLGCLAEKADGTLVGCGANWQPDYMAVGKGATPVAFQKVFRFVELAGPLQCGAATTSAAMCDPQWPALQQQFGATGPTATCGVVPEPVDGPPVVKKPTGCCDVRGGSSGGLGLALGVGLVLRRRRRAPQSASRQLG